MVIPNSFSINKLSENMFPLSYSVKVVNNIEVLYFTVVSVEDVFHLISNKTYRYLYLFGVDHYMEKDGKYISLKDILQNNGLNAEHSYDDETIVLKKEKFKSFMTFPQYNFEMFDNNNIMNDSDFIDFFISAMERLKNGELFLGMNNIFSKYYLNIHDDSLFYCETADRDLKNELLIKMLHDYTESYINIKHNFKLDITFPSNSLVSIIFNKYNKLTIRENGTERKQNEIRLTIYDIDFQPRREGNAVGMLTYDLNTGNWSLL